MRTIYGLVLVTFFSAAPISASPITAGVWTLVPDPSESGNTPWSNPSWDGFHQNLGFWENVTGMEYIHAPFIFPDAEWGPEQMMITALPKGFAIFLPSGVITYNNTIGDIYTSNGRGWENFWLLRTLDKSKYLLGIEDLPQGATDNDTDKYWFAQDKPRTVPEPSLLALLGLGALARRLRRKSWH